MRILLTGADGQLGRHLAPRLADFGELVRTDHRGGDFRCDLSDRRLVDKTLGRVQPDIVVNPAAWTAVDQAEDETELAGRLNAELPGWLAEWCGANDALLVHYSTDYVFSGEPGRGWREDDDPAPGNVYGRSKLEGERAIEQTGARAVILRTAWLYSHYPGNFVSAILTRALEGKPLTIVADQFGSPTWAGHLAAATCRVIAERDRLQGGCARFHVAGRGRMSWYEFGCLVVQRAAALDLLSATVEVSPIDSANWPQKARRPRWSVLDCERFERFAGEPLPSIEDGVEACLNEWKNSTC
jgi:dTDP-4-dehydrorhamnose reductase